MTEKSEEEKRQFVDNLEELSCKYAAGNLVAMEYEWINDTVSFGFADGTIVLNATVDDIAAMAKDILKEIWGVKMTEEFKKQLIELERINKKLFIEELGNICRRYDVGNVFAMRYERNEKTGEETVTVGFMGGGEKVVYVTADSLSTMVRDIFKVI